MQKVLKSALLKIIIIALLFGLAGGIVGDLLARVYLLGSYYNIPIFGDIDFSKSELGQQQLIIRNANKIIIEQNTKVDETVNSAVSSLVGIFKKVKTAKTATVAKPAETFNLADYYQPKDQAGQGLIITSDGWIITGVQFELEASGAKTNNLAVDYVVIDQAKNIYEIDNIIKDNLTGFNFIHVAARDFSVRKFAQSQDLRNGNLVLAINSNSQVWLTTIVGPQVGTNPVKSSDTNIIKLALEAKPGQNFSGSVIFDLRGDVIAFITSDGQALPITYFQAAVSSLLKFKEIKRASLGINYIDILELAKIDKTNGQKVGAVITKDGKNPAVVKTSAAEKAGLKENDVIISIDGTELDKNNDLSHIIGGRLAGDKITVVYLRGSEKKQTEVTLGQMK